MPVYFIHYTLITNGNSGDGNVDVRVDQPIRTIDDIRNIEKTLLDDLKVESLVISNFKRFDG